MSLTDRAMEVYKEEGVTNFIGRSLQFAGNKITNDSIAKEEVIENYSSDKKYLNIGGGNFLKQNWRVLDYYTDWYDYDSILVDYNIDLEKNSRWPIDSGDFNLVYSSHTLEHLTDSAVEHTLREAYRILSPGGTVRINVPDIRL
jgi:SAM-dependent methyltransferase